MRYQHLLYSRSLQKDYRWMILPTEITDAAVNKLNRLYNIYDRQKQRSSFSVTNVLPTFLLKLEKSSVLFQLGKTHHSDAYSRDIYGMWGISVSKKERRSFQVELPQLLQDYQSILDPFERIDFQDADKLTLTPSETYTLETESVSIRKLDPSLSANTKDQRKEIPFTEEGYQKLSDYFAMPGTPLVNFAFGVTEQMLRVLPPVKIVAKA